MANVRRSPYAFFYAEDDYTFEAASLLRGELPLASGEPRIVALAIVTGRRQEITRDQLDLFLSLPAGQWVDSRELGQEHVQPLIEAGLLLTDADAGRERDLRLRDESLSANAWNLFAALYHFMTQWSGVDTSDGDDDDRAVFARDAAVIEALVAQEGAPPDAFAEAHDGHRTVTLTTGDRGGELYRTLTSRRTSRAFDSDTEMTQEQLATILRFVFGCHGYTTTAGGVLCIKRTSPSGGALHPIETYPIVTNVAGVPSGIYHYGVRDHTLALLCELEASEAQRLAGSFMAGQGYFGRAHVSFILTARFYRNHWKYRRHPKAYAGILMDAAHLSQTLYLVSDDLGLGAFVTLAINGSDIEDYLNFDGVSEGVIAMAGCGPRAAGNSPLEPQFRAQPTTGPISVDPR